MRLAANSDPEQSGSPERTRLLRTPSWAAGRRKPEPGPRTGK